MPIYRKGEDQFPLAMEAFTQSLDYKPGHLESALRTLKSPVSKLDNVSVRGGDIAVLKDMGKLPQDRALPKNVTNLNDYKLKKGKQ
jgi:hypothetical protein